MHRHHPNKIRIAQAVKDEAFMNRLLEDNIRKYNYYKIFTKRVFLPLIAIFLIDQGGVSLKELAVIASITSFVQLFMEVPSGYIADRWGHKRSLELGALLCAISVLPYIFSPGFVGGLAASVGFFAGAAFSSGTIQAFIHETLLALGKDQEYSKIMGRGQSFGLLGNVILISLVPLTYAIHPKLPFIAGFICLFIAFLIVHSFENPKERVSVAKNEIQGVPQMWQELVKNGSIIRLLLVFVIFGIVSAGFDHSVMFREVTFKAVGLPVWMFGPLLALGSLIAALGGRYIHLLKKLSPLTFYVFDSLYLALICVLIGFTRNPFIIIIAFALVPAYDRTRNIIYESQILDEFSYSKRKATLISVMNFITLLNAIWIPLLLGRFVTSLGLGMGYMVFGFVIGCVLAFFITLQIISNKRTLRYAHS